MHITGSASPFHGSASPFHIFRPPPSAAATVALCSRKWLTAAGRRPAIKRPRTGRCNQPLELVSIRLVDQRVPAQVIVEVARGDAAKPFHPAEQTARRRHCIGNLELRPAGTPLLRRVEDNCMPPAEHGIGARGPCRGNEFRDTARGWREQLRKLRDKRRSAACRLCRRDTAAIPYQQHPVARSVRSKPPRPAHMGRTIERSRAFHRMQKPDFRCLEYAGRGRRRIFTQSTDQPMSPAKRRRGMDTARGSRCADGLAFQEGGAVRGDEVDALVVRERGAGEVAECAAAGGAAIAPTSGADTPSMNAPAATMRAVQAGGMPGVAEQAECCLAVGRARAPTEGRS
jgi:hypothetical protein